MMKAEAQLDALAFLFDRFVHLGDDRLSLTMSGDLSVIQALQTVTARPRAFLDGCVRKGWLARVGGRVYATGQFMRLFRDRWDSVPGFSVAMDALVTKVSMWHDTTGDMATIAAEGGVEERLRALTWATLLAAMPGLAALHTAPLDSYATGTLGEIRMREECMDYTVLTAALDASAGTPSWQSLQWQSFPMQVEYE